MVADQHFERGDPHDGSPALSRANYEYEKRTIPLRLQGVQRGLQVGCMHGGRVVSFSEAAPHVRIDGIEISPASVATAQNKVRKAKLSSVIFLGNITTPPAELLAQEPYDLVYSLNNTPGYFRDRVGTAIAQMQALSRGKVLLSLFSDERFTDPVADQYFRSMGMDTSHMEIEGNIFYLPGEDGNPEPIRRFSRQEVVEWGAQIEETPLGFYAILAGSREPSTDS